MKKGDKIILLTALAVVIISAVILIFSGNIGKKVTVKKNNKLVYEGSLYTEKNLDLSSNFVVIKGGKVWVSKANCKNQICVEHKAISKKGQSIICLPNKVIIEIA